MGSLSLLQGTFQTQVSRIADRFFTSWATRETQEAEKDWYKGTYLEKDGQHELSHAGDGNNRSDLFGSRADGGPCWEASWRGELIAAPSACAQPFSSLRSPSTKGLCPADQWKRKKWSQGSQERLKEHQAAWGGSRLGLWDDVPSAGWPSEEPF